MIRRSAVTDISPKAILLGGGVGAVIPLIVWPLSIQVDMGWVWNVVYLSARVLAALVAGGMVGVLATVFVCALRKPRRP